MANTPGDDGANIWFDGGYRMHASDTFMHQPVTSSPTTDAWVAGGAANDAGMALAPAFTPQGLRALYGTFYLTDSDHHTTKSRIEKVALQAISRELK